MGRRRTSSVKSRGSGKSKKAQSSKPDAPRTWPSTKKSSRGKTRSRSKSKKAERDRRPQLSPSTAATTPEAPPPYHVDKPRESMALSSYRRYQKFKYFRLIRTFSVADFVTMLNCFCGVASILFALNFLENQRYRPYIYWSFALLVLALVADVFDGMVARVCRRQSVYGADLDSLADVISFGVAPAVLGFTLGLRGFWDCSLLCYYVCAGVARLARYNVTLELLTDPAKGKVKFYEGVPIPFSLLLVGMWFWLFMNGRVFHDCPFGQHKVWGGTFHPLSLVYFFMGTAHISSRRIPKF